MPQLICKKALIMSDGKYADLTMDKSYDIVCAMDNDSGDDVVVVIVDDNEHHHYFSINDKLNGEDFTDYFDMLGDYTDVWENV
jgi:hypothetical protein